MALTRHGFAHLLLRGLELPLGIENYVSVVAWIAEEGNDARCNPLSIAGPDPPPPGASAYNTFDSGKLHVWNYPDLKTGLAATIKVIRLPYYNSVRVQMAHAVDAQATCERIAASPWGSWKEAGSEASSTIASLLHSVRSDWGRYAMAPIPGT